MATSIWFLTAESGDVSFGAYVCAGIVARTPFFSAGLSPAGGKFDAAQLLAPQCTHLSATLPLVSTSPALSPTPIQVIIEKHYTGTTGRAAVEVFWEEVSKRVKRDVRSGEEETECLASSRSR